MGIRVRKYDVFETKHSPKLRYEVNDNRIKEWITRGNGKVFLMITNEKEPSGYRNIGKLR